MLSLLQLSEDSMFARKCTQAGLVFIGPPWQAMEAMGNKRYEHRLCKAPNGPAQWSRGLDRSILKLYKRSMVRPEAGLVRTNSPLIGSGPLRALRLCTMKKYS